MSEPTAFLFALVILIVLPIGLIAAMVNPAYVSKIIGKNEVVPRWKLLFGFFAAFIVSLAGLGLSVRSDDKPTDSPAPDLSASSQVVPAKVEQVSTPEPVADSPKVNNTFDPSLEAEIYRLRPMIGDSENQPPRTALELASWNVQNKFRWSDMSKLPLTTYGKVMKDSDAEFGKRLCIAGNIIEIQTDRSLGNVIYHAGLADEDVNIVRAIALESSGDLVENSQARFCGVVMGKMRFANAAGGTTSAPYLVGLFDLPENKKL